MFGSLITFPAHLHWMAATWLAISLVANANKKPMWPWLAGCVLIISIKRPGYTPEFWILSILYLVVALLDWQTGRRKPRAFESGRLIIYALILVVATNNYGIVRWFAANTSRQPTLDERPIACVGDSLTDCGYPQELEKLISVPVADFGVDGIKTTDGIEMIPEILAIDPQIVVIELGGHDYNADGRPRWETRANLVTLIEAFRKRDIEVILVEIPRGFVSDPYDGVERELAARYDLQLIDDSVIRRFVFNSSILPPGMWLDPSERYSDDGLHPNELGNKHFAQIVLQSLIKVYGDSIINGS